MATCEMRVVKSGRDLQMKGECLAQKNGKDFRTDPSCQGCCLRWLFMQKSADERARSFFEGQICGTDVDASGSC